MLKNPRPCIYAHTLCSYVHFNVGDLCESQKSVIWSSRWIFEGTIKIYLWSTYVITISSFNILLRIHCHSSLLFALRKMFNVWVVFFLYILIFLLISHSEFISIVVANVIFCLIMKFPFSLFRLTYERSIFLTECCFHK